MSTPLSWRETATKVCAGCQQTFRPGPKQKRAHWESVSNCSLKCGSASRRHRDVGDLDPAEQHTPGARPEPLMSANEALPDIILALDAIWGALNAGGAVLEALIDPDDLRLVAMRDALRIAADYLQPILPQ